MAATPIPENRAAFTSSELVGATGAAEIAPSSRAICGVSTDSRSVEAGNLFVALRG
jgi:UDP-N-acetylmuramyl pentapeptide synthase